MKKSCYFVKNNYKVLRMVIKSNKNFYEILGVTPDVELSELKSVYRRLVRKYHPDINPGSEERFKALTNAYETLSDDKLRHQYDILNGIFRSTNKKTEPKYKPEENSKTASANEDRNIEEIYRKTFHKKFDTTSETQKASQSKTGGAKEKFEKAEKVFTNVINDILDGISATSAKKKSEKLHDSKKGDDISTDISISLKESITGTCRVVNIMQAKVCPKCAGRKFINDAKCPECGGKGETARLQKINVSVPPHVKNGARLRISGEGKPGINGGKNGDLYLNVTIAKDKNFRIEGNDIYCEVPITPYEAALGGDIKIPSLEGDVVLKLPPSVLSGQIFRLSSAGLKKNNKIGDIIITVRIQIQKNLTVEELELYRKLKDLSVENIRESLLND